MIDTYRVCHSCAYGLQYGDTSGMDGYQLAAFENFSDRVGILVPVGKAEGLYHWDCDGHGEAVDESTGYLFETLRD